MEDRLTALYPLLDIRFNDVSAIGLELDIFIPSISLGIELNGLLHYKPIYGKTRFDRMKANDKRKAALCIENSIRLLVIDTREQKVFSTRSSKQFLDIIIAEIEKAGQTAPPPSD